LGTFLGLDVGTTTLTALIMDAESGRTTSVVTLPNNSQVTSASDHGLGRSEWDANRMLELAFEAISDVTAGGGIEGIGVTGQMHGMLLVSASGKPLSPFIGWQDRRGAECFPGTNGSYVEKMLDLASRIKAECRPHVGYLGASLFWMCNQERLPDEPFKATFLPDFIVSRLTETDPVTDATNAAGSGLYDTANRRWHGEYIGCLGLNPDNLPRVVPSGSLAGTLSDRMSSRTGLPTGLPVYVACGDNQASFAGSVGDYNSSLLVNVGTGGQVSANVPKATTTGELEARPFMDGSDLLVGAGLVGGRSYAWLRDFFRQIGTSFFGRGEDADLYEMMNHLASQIPPGSEGLRCEPLFTGTRKDPKRRGIWAGVGTSNFTPGHMSRALLEGLSQQFRDLYGQMESLGAGGRTKLVGAGNGIRKNSLLRSILEEAFEMIMAVPTHKEEAAFGAALLAAVGSGRFNSLSDAGSIIKYQ
jgi:sugar (pentulose or hexulose) kinase